MIGGEKGLSRSKIPVTISSIFNFIQFSHHHHTKSDYEQDSYGRDLEKAADDFDDSFEPSSRTVAKQRWDTAVSSTRNMVIAQIDLYQYKQEEIDVEVRDMKIYVKGRHVTERENGYDASEFERFYAVPEGVDPKKVSTRYSDGMLKIEAPRPKRESQPRKIAGGEIVSDEEKFEIVLDVRNYKPDEIEVKVNGDDLIVTGKQEIEEQGRRVTRQFTRNFKLPRDVNVRTVKSRVSVDGYLYVYAKKEITWDEERVINILVNGRRSPIRKSEACFTGEEEE